MPDTIAHLSLAGVAAGLVAGVSAIPSALAVSVAAAFGIERLREKRTLPGETIVSMFLFGGLALAVVLFGLARGKNVNVVNLLFGSVLTVDRSDLLLITALGAVTVGAAAILWPMLFAVSLDEEAAEATGLPVRPVNRALAALGAAVVAVSINVVGLLLIGALMVVPVLAAMKLGLGFFRTWAAAVIISVFSVVVGLSVSYHLDLASGGTIVLVAITLFLLCSLVPATRRPAGKR
jgi:zinc transport system permease protein